MTQHAHRLEGLEPDNLLAFLALLGLLRALEEADRSVGPPPLHPRVAWDLDAPPLRPLLILAREATEAEVAEAAAEGLRVLPSLHDFDGERDVAWDWRKYREILAREALAAGVSARGRVDLFSALASDAAIKDEKSGVVQPTPLCLQFGQGHQHFLERLAAVPRQASPPPRGRGRSRVEVPPTECLSEALFRAWHRRDSTFSFRWDPEEDVRYALMAGDPTDPAHKPGTQHGANRLAAVGLAALPVVPVVRGGRARAAIPGGDFGDGFSFAWPIWREPASLSAIRALLGHPKLRQPGALRHLGVEHVLVARRISVGKYMNIARARPTAGGQVTEGT